jgi:DoxX-like family
VNELVARGQTAVEGLPASLVHTIGALELLGIVRLVVPWWSQIVRQLTPLAASCLAVVVLLATGIHIKRREFGTAIGTATLVALCAFVAVSRFSNLYATRGSFEQAPLRRQTLPAMDQRT